MSNEVNRSCVRVDRIAAPCASCRQYSERVHFIDGQAFYCETCCPICNGGYMADREVSTTQGRQENLFGGTNADRS